MPLFAYRAVNARGRVLRGRLEARDLTDVTRALRAAGLHPLGLVSVPPAREGGMRRLARRRRVPLRELEHLCLHLERALDAGVPLLEALADARSVTVNAALAAVLDALAQDVGRGHALSEALARQEARLDPVMAPLIRAGEESGHLTQAFQTLGAHLAWRDDLKRRLGKAVRYPLLVLSVLAGVLFFLTGAVLPDLSTFLAGLGDGPPVQTRALLATSQAMGQLGPWIALGFALAGLGLTVGRRLSPEIAYRIDALLLHLPLIGPLIRRLALARFAHGVALLFQAGVALPQCLAIGRGVLGNRCLAEALDTAAAAVSAGHPLSEALRLSGQFPPLVWRMVRVGEDGGDLAGALEHVGRYHDRDATESSERLVALSEPLLLLVAGGLMAWIVWAVLLPVYDALSGVSL
ncbi:type II secretion system F family protein [Pararhodospirillum photometricum]|uniref:type II secretion system F family protein n=1 Tax=Pararhodospirillum photometricum TaxID=1084 RepID=UPI0002DF5510|nr:type II secretion system F family protein [Pararhodospirillum photometricum]